jgi:DNA-binding CsgD family transcriptional regulator
MMTHVRRAPPTTSVYPGRILWTLLRTVDDDDLGAPAREEFRDVVARYHFPSFVHGAAMIEGVAAGRAGDTERATAMVDTAHRSLTAQPYGLGTVHATATVVARAAMRDGWGTPAAWLRAAEAFFAAGGYARLARRCRLLLAEAGAPVPRRRGDTEVPPGLRARGVTGREVDVLKLVVAGRTNNEIAEALVLSPKTVERHVSSLFGRLGVRDRRDLAAVGAPHLA